MDMNQDKLLQMKIAMQNAKGNMAKPVGIGKKPRPQQPQNPNKPIPPMGQPKQIPQQPSRPIPLPAKPKTGTMPKRPMF